VKAIHYWKVAATRFELVTTGLMSPLLYLLSYAATGHTAGGIPAAISKVAGVGFEPTTFGL
jgi:hypothetical protein